MKAATQIGAMLVIACPFTALALWPWEPKPAPLAVPLTPLTIAPVDPATPRALPLFAASATDPAIAPGALPPPIAGLIGRFPGDGVALVRTRDGRTRSAAEGETVDGWRITALTAERVSFRQGTKAAFAYLPRAEGDQ